MPYITTDDGVKLYYEVTGSGTPLVFVHEFAGDWRSWEPQVRYFSRYYQCITYSARGFAPSDAPEDAGAYSQARARDDLLAIVDGLGLENPHLVGLSMGGFAVLHFGISYPGRARSLVISGVGYGAEPDKREQFAVETEKSAQRFETLGMERAAEVYALGPTRVQFQNKDPRGWAEFHDQLKEHLSSGSANTMRGVQKARPSLFSLKDELKKIDTPTFVIIGDEDWPCVQSSLLLKQCISTAGLSIVPNTGHTINLEEPAVFNSLVCEFLHAVELGRWPKRDSRSMVDALLGVEEVN